MKYCYNIKKQAIHEVEDAIKTLNYRYYINGDIYKKNE